MSCPVTRIGALALALLVWIDDAEAHADALRAEVYAQKAAEKGAVTRLELAAQAEYRETILACDKRPDPDALPASPQRVAVTAEVEDQEPDLGDWKAVIRAIDQEHGFQVSR